MTAFELMAHRAKAGLQCERQIVANRVDQLGGCEPGMETADEELDSVGEGTLGG